MKKVQETAGQAVYFLQGQEREGKDVKRIVLTVIKQTRQLEQASIASVLI